MSARGRRELTLESRDHRALTRFHQEALGLPLLGGEDDRIRLACGPNDRLRLSSVGEKEFGDRGGRHVHFAFAVPHGELGIVGRRLRELGTRARGPVEHGGGDQSLYFRTPTAPRGGVGLLRGRRRRGRWRGSADLTRLEAWIVTGGGRTAPNGSDARDESCSAFGRPSAPHGHGRGPSGGALRSSGPGGPRHARRRSRPRAPRRTP